MAKRLLDKKGATYTEINVDREPGQREIMMHCPVVLCLQITFAIAAEEPQLEPKKRKTKIDQPRREQKYFSSHYS